MKADEEVLKVLIEHDGEHVWDRDATIMIKRPNGTTVHRRAPAPEASFRRLSLEGYVQVETHTVSVWKFGPRDNFAQDGYIPTLRANVAKLDEMDTPTWRNRVDIRVALTDRGWQYAADLGLPVGRR